MCGSATRAGIDSATTVGYLWFSHSVDLFSIPVYDFGGETRSGGAGLRTTPRHRGSPRRVRGTYRVQRRRSGDACRALAGTTRAAHAPRRFPLVSCSWGFPSSDGLFWLTIVTLEQNASDELVRALRSSDEYVNGERDGAPVFAHYVEVGMGHGVGYAFDGLTWVIVSGTLLDAESAARLAGDALISVRALNE